MSKVKFKLKISGLNKLMKSEEMQTVLNDYGQQIVGRANSSSGAEYGYRTHVAKWVAITNVYPDSKKAAKDNYENNTLLKSI